MADMINTSGIDTAIDKLQKYNNVLNNSINELNTHANIFNNASSSIIKDTEAMGISATELRDKINKLLLDAQGLSKLGKSINTNEQGQVDEFVTKIKELDRTLSDLSPVIFKNIKEMNSAFQREFRLDDGTTGYLKEQLNVLRTTFKDDYLKTDVARLAPDLSDWADKFVEQVNKIEYAMGRLTEFGKQRNETEKALGFIVSQKDIAHTKEAKRAELAEYDSDARDYGYSGAGDKAYLRDFPEAAQDIESINIYIKQLDNAVGKKIKGYVELFNEAQNLLKSGQSNQALYETIGSSMTRSMYGDNVDWSKITPSKFKELQLDLNGDDEFFGNNKIAESIAKVEETSNKAVASVHNYGEEINKLVESDKVLSNEQKQGILGQDFSNSIKKYGKDVDYFKNQLQSLGSIKLVDMPVTQLDPNKTEDFTALNNYKSNINGAIDSLEILKKEQAKLFSDLSDPTTMSKIMGSPINQDLINDIKSVLESGYKVNLLDGSADKEKLDQLRAGFEKLISEFKSYNIDITPDKEIEDLAKLDALQQAINTESRRQAEIAKAQANYEKDKVVYLEQYNKIAQAQANIKALENTRNSLMTGASKEDKKAIYERYDTEIASNKSIIRSAEQTIAKYKAKFTESNLEIPVTPVVKNNTSLSGQFKSEFIRLKASGRNEILGELSGQDATITKLNQQAQELGINVEKINSRLTAMKNTLNTAFYSGNIEKAKNILSTYSEEVNRLANRVNGQAQAQEIATDRKIQAERQYAEELKKQEQAQQDVVNQAKANTEKVVGYIQSALNTISNIMNKLVGIVKWSISTIGKTVELLKTAFNGVVSTIQRVLQLFGNFGNRLGLVNRQGNILKGTFTELRSKIQLLTGALNKLLNNQFIKQGEALLSSIQTLNIIVGGELTQSTIEWANELERGFGLSASGIIADLKELTGVMHGLGMNGEDTNIASKNLAMLANSLSTIIGYDTSTVVNKIQSGMKGMTQSIDDLGLSVREAQMDAFLKDLKKQGGEYANIATSFSSLTEQQRIYVRYAAIMKQFLDKYDAETYAKSLDSITGRLSVLKNQLRTLKALVGTFALKLFDKVVKPLTYIVFLIGEKIKQLASFFNIDLELDAGMNDNGETSENFDEIADSAEKAEEAINNAKGSLDGWDHVSSMSSSSASNGSEFDYSSLMDFIEEDYAKALEEISKTREEYMEEAKKALDDWLHARAESIRKWFEEVTGRNIDLLGIQTWLQDSWATIKKIGENIKSICKNIVDIVGGIFGMIFDDLDFTELSTKLLESFERLTHLINVVLARIEPYIIRFYNNCISPLIVALGDKLGIKLDESKTSLESWIDWWADPRNEVTISGWFKNLEYKFETLKKKIKEVLVVLKTAIFGEESLSMDDVIVINENKANGGKLDGYVSKAGSLHTILSTISEIVGTLAQDFKTWLDEEGLDKITQNMETLADTLSTHKDDIISVIETIASVEFNIEDTAFDKLMEVLNWVGDNSELVSNAIELVSNAIEKLIENIELLLVGLLGVKAIGGLANLGLAKMGLGALFGGGNAGMLGKGAVTATTGALTATEGTLGATATIAGAGVGSKFLAGFKSKLLNIGGTLTSITVPLTLGVKGIEAGVKIATGDIKLVSTEARERLNGLLVYNRIVLDNLKKAYGEDIPLSGLEAGLEEYRQTLINLGVKNENTLNQMIESARTYANKHANVYDNINPEIDNTNALNALSTLNTKTDETKKKSDELRNKISQPLKTNTYQAQTGLYTINRLYDTLYNKSLKPITIRVQTINSSVQSNNRWGGINTIRGFANGGTPKSGSIFYANENGNIELAGNFGGYTGVANQQMIISAMQNAISNSMYTAMSQIMRNNTPANGNTTIEVCKGGVFVGDNSSIRKLAGMINNVNTSNLGNIANTAFSM